MRTRHVFAGSFFGKMKVVSPKLNSRAIFCMPRSKCRPLRQNRELITAERGRTENIDY